MSSQDYPDSSGKASISGVVTPKQKSVSSLMLHFERISQSPVHASKSGAEVPKQKSVTSHGSHLKSPSKSNSDGGGKQQPSTNQYTGIGPTTSIHHSSSPQSMILSPSSDSTTTFDATTNDIIAPSSSSTEAGTSTAFQKPNLTEQEEEKSCHGHQHRKHEVEGSTDFDLEVERRRYLKGRRETHFAGLTGISILCKQFISFNKRYN